MRRAKIKDILCSKYGILSLAILCTTVILIVTTIRPSEVKMTDVKGLTRQISLPIIQPSNPEYSSTEYDFTGELNIPLLSQHIVNVTADDCLKYFRINGVTVDLDKVIKGNTCDSLKGIDIDLQKYLKYGKNKFEIGIIDYGGRFVLSIKNSYYDPLFIYLLGILILEVTILFYSFLRNYLGFSNKIIILLLLGLLIRIIYLTYTTYAEKEHDVLEWGGHLYYVQYVAQTLQIPQLNQGWEYAQAPLYYIGGAIIYNISNGLGLNYTNLLQLLSISYSFIFLIFGTLIFRLLFNKKSLFFLATALLVFWPSGIIDSIWISNDPMYYMMTAVTIYLLMKWVTEWENKYFYLVSFFAGLTIATKLNGIIITGILGCCFLYKCFKDKQKIPYLKRGIFLTIIILIALSGSLFRNLLTYATHKDINLINIITPYPMNAQLAVHNDLYNFLYFDGKTFITQPFTDSWFDIGGRQYFWNFFLKSMLFGEFSFSPIIQQSLAKVLSILLLAIVMFCFLGVILSLKKMKSVTLLMFFYLIISLISLINYRHTYSYAPNADFRLIFPAIIPYIYFYLLGINFFMQTKLKFIASFGYLLSYLFVIASFLFFILPLFLPG